MFKFLTALAFILLSPHAANAQSGKICIASVPMATSGSKSLTNGTASSVPYDFTVSFDGNKPLKVSHKTPIKVSGLSLAARHRVQIRQGGRPKASFVFSFSDHETDNLCLWFKSLHETWSLTAPGRMPWCRCDRKPAA